MARPLGSTLSADRGAPPSLFERFSATISLSDFPPPCIAVVLLSDSQRGPWGHLPGVRGGISRLPCKQLPYVHRVSRPRGGGIVLAIANGSMLPSDPTTTSAPRSHFPFAAHYLARTYPCQRFACTLTSTHARLGVSMVRYSFTVRDSHSLLLTGLCRRTVRSKYSVGQRILWIEGLMGVRASKSQANSVEKPTFRNGLAV